MEKPLYTFGGKGGENGDEPNTGVSKGYLLPNWPLARVSSIPNWKVDYTAMGLEVNPIEFPGISAGKSILCNGEGYPLYTFVNDSPSSQYCPR